MAAAPDEPAAPARLIVGALSAHEDAWRAARETLLAEFGPADDQAGPWDFGFTDYYAAEMGAPLSRWFLALARPVGQEALAAVKRRTIELERELAAAGRWPVRRPVNLDPGVVTLTKLVLASTKDWGHRVCIAPGLYGEVTLRYARGSFRSCEWTYPDFRRPEQLEFLNRVRARLRAAR